MDGVMRVLSFCLMLLLAGCAAPGPDPTAPDTDPAPEPSDPAPNRWTPDLPRIHASADVTGSAWTFSVAIENQNNASIWLAQRSCEVGAGVSLHNDTHGGTSSTQAPGLACGWGPGIELAPNATHRFSWAWNGTLHDGRKYVPAPAGVYDVTLWTSWSEGDWVASPAQSQDTRIKAHWPGK